MMTSPMEQTMPTLEISREVQIAAPIDVVFETILEQLGPLNEAPDGTRLSMKLEPWPGGRWLRDLGDNRGHLWGFVQSIKPNELLELQGPMFMSAPVLSHVLYRLSEENGTTRIQFSHRAVGQIPEQISDGVNVNKGWAFHLERVKTMAERQRP